jgi:hypothetical protein
MGEHSSDLHRLWHEQPREEITMSIDEIRSKADRFERKVRRWNAFATCAFALAVGAEVWSVLTHPAVLERVGDGLTLVALVYVVLRYRPYVAVSSMPAGLGVTASTDFYRLQLARQRDLTARPWAILALFMPGVMLSLFGNAVDGPGPRTVAIAVFAVSLFVGVAWLSARTARTLQRDIDELG